MAHAGTEETLVSMEIITYAQNHFCFLKYEYLFLEQF